MAINKTDQISLLYQITQILNKTADLKQSLYNMLELISKSQGMVRGTITILDPFSDEISIEIAHGISKSALQKGKYKLGEGITGQVIQTGEPVTILKRGRPVARLIAATASQRRHPQDDLAGTVEILGDIDSPVLPAAVWHAEQKRRR